MPYSTVPTGFRNKINLVLSQLLSSAPKEILKTYLYPCSCPIRLQSQNQNWGYITIKKNTSFDLAL